MGILIETADFKGKYKVSQNSYTELDRYIEKYEDIYLFELFGLELYTLFIADLDTQVPKQPQSAEFKEIYNPLKIMHNDNPIHSVGMREMLLGFIYFEYMRDEKYKSTVSGKVTNVSENSREASFTEFNIYDRYNGSVQAYNAIQCFMLINADIYPLFKGQMKFPSYWL